MPVLLDPHPNPLRKRNLEERELLRMFHSNPLLTVRLYSQAYLNLPIVTTTIQIVSDSYQTNTHTYRATVGKTTTRTAWEWFKNGTLPVPARQLSTGTILVDVPETHSGRTVVYARVASHDQKPNLDGQVARCVTFANGRGLAVSETITEVGSGMNEHRKKRRIAVRS